MNPATVIILNVSGHAIERNQNCKTVIYVVKKT